MEKGNVNSALNSGTKIVLIVLSIGIAVVLSSLWGFFINFLAIPLTIALFIGFNKIKLLVFPAAVIIGSSIYLAASNCGLAYTSINSKCDTIIERILINLAFYGILAAFGLVAGFILRAGYKNKGKITLKIITAFLATLIVAFPVGYIAGEFHGNPILALVAKYRIENSLGGKYPNVEFELKGMKYSFKDGEYYTVVKADKKAFNAYYNFSKKTVRDTYE